MVFIMVDVVNITLLLPMDITIIHTFDPARRTCKDYFKDLVSECKDRYILEKIVEINIRIMTSDILLYLEFSRYERVTQIHAKFLYGILKCLENLE